jgi:hypothetical protein
VTLIHITAAVLLLTVGGALCLQLWLDANPRQDTAECYTDAAKAFPQEEQAIGPNFVKAVKDCMKVKGYEFNLNVLTCNDHNFPYPPLGGCFRHANWLGRAHNPDRNEQTNTSN